MQLMILLSLLSAVGSEAALSRSFSIEVQGVKSESPAKARISYLDACARARSELRVPGFSPFIKLAACSAPVLVEGPRLFQAAGALNVTLKRVMEISARTLETDYSESEQEAGELWTRLCEEWRLEAGPKTVFLGCGTPVLDTFYVKPRVWSRAVAVEKVRVAQERGQYCHCRARSEEIPPGENEKWHRHPRYRTVYDLMVLVESGGYYEKNGSFSSQEACGDELVRHPLCSEEE